MESVADIQKAILSLPETEYVQLRQWFNELDSERWDRQIEEDSENGKLDFIAAEVLEAKREGTLQDLREGL
jgi:hypothetical protein